LNKVRKKIRVVFWCYVVMFAVLVFSVINIIMDKEMMADTYNPRIENLADEN